MTPYYEHDSLLLLLSMKMGPHIRFDSTVATTYRSVYVQKQSHAVIFSNFALDNVRTWYWDRDFDLIEESLGNYIEFLVCSVV